MLNPYRRHSKDCPHKAKGRDWIKCNCPIHVDGMLGGVRYRDSLKTRDWARAQRRIAQLLEGGQKPSKRIAEAVMAFLSYMEGRASGTIRNNRRVLALFQTHIELAGARTVEQIDVSMIDGYRANRSIAASTWVKELEILRHFFAFAVEREWIERNPAARVKAPKPKRKPIEVYSTADIVAILAACDKLGAGAYERLRAKAMVLILRDAALRVGDVATLERARVRFFEDGSAEFMVWTMKTAQAVWIPLERDTARALQTLPNPRGAAGESRYFFWSGNGTTKAAVRDVERTLGRVFELSEVPGAHAHRFRHTMATRILGNGGTAEDAANILGNSPAVILRHYATFSVQRQERIRSLLQAVRSGTDLAQLEKQDPKCSEQRASFGGRHGIRSPKTH